jgi:hypothetical protein
MTNSQPAHQKKKPNYDKEFSEIGTEPASPSRYSPTHWAPSRLHQFPTPVR